MLHHHRKPGQEGPESGVRNRSREAGGRWFTGFFSSGLLSCFAYTVQAHLPRVGITHNGWDLLHQLAVKKCPIDTSTDQSNRKRFPFFWVALVCVKLGEKKPSQHRDERGKVRRCLQGRCQGHHGAIESGLENQRSGRKVFENTFFS